MKFKLFLISVLFLALPCIVKAQSNYHTIKGVAYFPTPYLTHTSIKVNQAYFANGVGDGQINIADSLTFSNLTAKKDLRLTSDSNTVINNIYVGTQGNAQAGGSFIAGTNTLTVSNLLGSPRQINSDNFLKVKSIYWQNGSNTENEKAAFLTTNMPSGTTKLCWSPLRIKGTYTYRYYLIAVSDCCPEEKVGGNCPQ